MDWYPKWIVFLGEWENNRRKRNKQTTPRHYDTRYPTDCQGKLWLGTFGKGLNVFSPEGKRIMHFDTSNGMKSNAVNSLYMDSKGRLWVATRAGIVHINDTSNPKLEIYNHKQGLIDENVRSIIEDKKGNIWLSTNGGIAQWKSDEKDF